MGNEPPKPEVPVKEQIREQKRNIERSQRNIEREMKKLESHGVSANEAKQFAAAGGLSATAIPYLKGTK